MKKLINHLTFLILSLWLFYYSLTYLIMESSWIIFLHQIEYEIWLKIIITKCIFEMNNF